MSAIGSSLNLDTLYPAVSSMTAQEQLQEDEKGKFFTTGKVKKIALGFFGMLLGAGAIATISYAIFQGSLLALIPVALLTIVSIGCFLTISKIKDYEDPKCLAEYRQKAQGQSIRETAQEHGWDKVFQYGIPLPRDFARLFRAEAERKDLNSVLNFYEELKSESVYHQSPKFSYSIPLPREFAYKFEEEIQGLNPCEIFDRFNISRLEKHKILNTENKLHLTLINFKGSFETIRNSYNQKLKAIKDEFDKNIYLPYSQLISVERSIQHAEKLRNQYNGVVSNRRFEHSLDYIREPSDFVHGARFWGDVIVGDRYIDGINHQQLLIQARSVYEQQVAPFVKILEDKNKEAKACYDNERKILNGQFLANLK